MTDQYTRISSGGSPLSKNDNVVGLLFGLLDRNAGTSCRTTTKSNNNDTTVNEGKLLEVLEADDIPVEVSEASILQVDLHTAVFPKQKVVGWYRVSAENEEPTPVDLSVTMSLKEHYSLYDPFCFCLLKVQKKTEFC
jgi:hypothetical protein